MQEHSGAVVSRIQRFSVDDGPGIRTTVFFKGCNLSCFWCHNPECIPMMPEFEYHKALCLHCGRCVETCKQDCHRMDAEAEHLLNREGCTSCMACVRACPFGALNIVGTPMEQTELLTKLLADRLFYDKSGGGVTFSGGEPLLQGAFLSGMLRRCREHGLHTAVDTAGNVPWDRCKESIRLADIILYDLKFVTPRLHKKWTGVSNERILENLKTMTAMKKRLWVRIPVIPGANDGSEMAQMADLCNSLEGIERLDLLPYHSYGSGKYALLGRENRMPATSAPNPETLVGMAELFKNTMVMVEGVAHKQGEETESKRL